MYTWRKSLPEFLDRVWQEISDFDTPRTGTPGCATMATVSPSGLPQLRTVVLRDADRAAGLVETASDLHATKIGEIANAPEVGLLIWQPDTGLQIRLQGTARTLFGADAAQTWADMPDSARLNYGVEPPPGRPIDTPGNYSRRANAERFARLIVTLTDIDAVHLGPPHDIRAVFRREDDWRGEWRTP